MRSDKTRGKLPALVTSMLASAPHADEAVRVCPSCGLSQGAFPDLAPPSGVLAKCPHHGLAFIERQELAAAGGDPLLGTTIAGRFTILGRLGRGSMGSVYRARQEAVRRDVALKIVRRERAYDPETKARFEREARAISSLTSPHTVTAFDFGEAADGSWFLAMEMLSGETVGDRLRRERRIEWVDATLFARDALSSLAEAHRKGIIHRDLKPDNLFLVRSPPGLGELGEHCKVLDFGIAKWLLADDAGPIDQLETQAGTVFGTPRYMSPEQAQGTPLDARSDLYSLGVMLYQMLCGRAPFVDDDAVVVMARHIKDAPPPFAEVAPDAHVPLAIEAVVLRALAKSPDARPQTAEQMSAELEHAFDVARSQSSGVRAVALEAEELSERRRSFVMALVLAALATLIVGTFVATRHDRSRRPTEGSAPAALPSALATPLAMPATTSDGSSVSELSESERVAPPAPPAPTESGNSAQTRASENSVLAVLPSAAPREIVSAARVPRAHPSSLRPDALPRKRNERYGRFE